RNSNWSDRFAAERIIGGPDPRVRYRRRRDPPADERPESRAADDRARAIVGSLDRSAAIASSRRGDRLSPTIGASRALPHPRRSDGASSNGRTNPTEGIANGDINRRHEKRRVPRRDGDDSRGAPAGGRSADDRASGDVARERAGGGRERRQSRGARERQLFPS